MGHSNRCSRWQMRANLKAVSLYCGHESQCSKNVIITPGRRQAIIWTSAEILLIGPLVTKFSKILTKKSYIFIQENVFEIVVWKMSAILSRPQCVNALDIRPVYSQVCRLWPLLLTWFKFNPSMDKLSHAQKSVGWNYLQPLKFRNG